MEEIVINDANKVVIKELRKILNNIGDAECYSSYLSYLKEARGRIETLISLLEGE